jgi:hypothetical protein
MTWLIPALKLVLPHVGDILSAAKPVFTKKTANAADAPLQQQITELQAAASQNAANIAELARELQATVAALEKAGLVAQAKLRRALVLCALALAVSGASLCAALYVILGR